MQFSHTTVYKAINSHLTVTYYGCNLQFMAVTLDLETFSMLLGFYRRELSLQQFDYDGFCPYIIDKGLI